MSVSVEDTENLSGVKELVLRIVSGIFPALIGFLSDGT